MTISTYAVVQGGHVVNLVLWDGEDDWTPPQDSVAIPVPEGDFVDIGFSYDGVSFSKAK
ncbi:hypothetical protein [Burkholderia cenocepacia]|uniref:hypothetical protein n=1 Tax=Burkholderia cenocepacia TaxID=95486 RepID=UPI00162767C5|nr:hypothetical protein [Burkholderia cenocepacia]